MAKKVFNRIWRTGMVLVNTVWNLFSIVLAFYALFESNSYARANVIEGWIYSVIIITAVNIVNFVTRKHFQNY